MKKASLELSVNFIVMLIISLLVFGLGLTILFKTILGDTIGPVQDLDEQTKKEISNMLIRGGQKVAFPYHEIQIERGEHSVMGFGIRNDGQGGEWFMIDTKCKVGLDNKETVICNDAGGPTCTGHDKWIGNDGSYYRVAHQDKAIQNLMISIPKNAQKGTYSFDLNVKICQSNTDTLCLPYDTTKKFYVKVI